jgi:hypothetical protein
MFQSQLHPRPHRNQHLPSVIRTEHPKINADRTQRSPLQVLLDRWAMPLLSRETIKVGTKGISKYRTVISVYVQ